MGDHTEADIILQMADWHTIYDGWVMVGSNWVVVGGGGEKNDNPNNG